MKNVAGYDLGKLVCGSRGRLAFIGRVSLRLHPAPAAAATVVVETRRSGLGRGGAARLAPRPERARRAPAGPRRGALRGRRRGGRSPGRGNAQARRRDRGRRVRVGGVSRTPGRSARPGVVRARGAWRLPRTRPGGRRPSRRRDRVPSLRRRRTRRPSRSACCRSASARGSTRLECWRERRPRRPPLADRRVRPLRLLPPDLPDLSPLERGDGLAARPDPADRGEPRRHAHAQPDRDRALRRLPRMHGVRHRLPLGRPVRPPDRVDARDDRDRDHAAVPRPLRARSAVQAAPLSPADGACAAPGAARPQAAAPRSARGDDRDRAAVALDGEARSSHARGWRDPRACRHSHRLRAVRGVRVGQRRHGPGARRRRLRGRGAAAGVLRRALDTRRPRRGRARLRASRDRGVRGRRDGDRRTRRAAART